MDIRPPNMESLPILFWGIWRIYKVLSKGKELWENYYICHSGDHCCGFWLQTSCSSWLSSEDVCIDDQLLVRKSQINFLSCIAHVQLAAICMYDRKSIA